MQNQVISGISPGFPELSPSQRQVAHVLLTRSPLTPPPKKRDPLDLHVLSTPPAFVLSQDQTLQQSIQRILREITPTEPHTPKREDAGTPPTPFRAGEA